MKKSILIAFTLIFNLHFTQNKFVQGYIINESGQKTDVLISDLDWLNNPKEFEYKTLESAEIKKGNLENIREFGTRNSYYIKETVDIDRSSENLSFLSTDEKPTFKSENLFLKKIVQGKANLYMYKDGNTIRFFYNTDNNTPTQLIYKAYNTNQSGVSYNEEFKKQLKKDLTCNLTEREINNTHYRLDNLEKIFIKFNNCSNNSSAIVQENEEKPRDWFNLSLRVGINQSKYSLSSIESTSINSDFETENSLRLGVEFEFILPFNNGNWTIIAEPYFTSYKTSKIGESSRIYAESVPEKRTVDYTGFQLPVGLRYYLPIGTKSKLFTNLSFSIQLSAKTEVNYEYNRDFYSKSAGNKFEFGVGYKYINMLSAELRLHSKQDLIRTESNYTSSLQTVSLVLGYTPF